MGTTGRTTHGTNQAPVVPNQRLKATNGQATQQCYGYLIGANLSYLMQKSAAATRAGATGPYGVHSKVRVDASPIQFLRGDHALSSHDVYNTLEPIKRQRACTQHVTNNKTPMLHIIG